MNKCLHTRILSASAPSSESRLALLSPAPLESRGAKGRETGGWELDMRVRKARGK